MVGELVAALGPLPDLSTRQPLGIVEQLAHVGLDLAGTVAGQQLLQAALADLRGGILGGQVAPHAIGHAHVDLDHRGQRLVQPAAVVELEGRDAQPFLVDLGGIGSVGAGHPAADVGVVADHHRERPPLAAEEQRHEHEDVRQVHAAVVGVVHDHGVAVA